MGSDRDGWRAGLGLVINYLTLLTFSQSQPREVYIMRRCHCVHLAGLVRLLRSNFTYVASLFH